MKHTTNMINLAPVNTSSRKRMIGLRLPDEEFFEIEEFAKNEHRPIAQFTRLIVHLGVAEYKKRQEQKKE